MLANRLSYMCMHAWSRVFPTLIGFIFSSTSLRDPPASKARPYFTDNPVQRYAEETRLIYEGADAVAFGCRTRTGGSLR
jgi:hypothetical protein